VMHPRLLADPVAILQGVAHADGMALDADGARFVAAPDAQRLSGGCGVSCGGGQDQRGEGQDVGAHRQMMRPVARSRKMNMRSSASWGSP